MKFSLRMIFNFCIQTNGKGYIEESFSLLILTEEKMGDGLKMLPNTML